MTFMDDIKGVSAGVAGNAAGIAAGVIADTNLDAMFKALTFKRAADVATTANLTLATGLVAGQTVDSITLTAGMRVLVKDQTTASQNGVYIVGTGAPTRATDFDESSEISGAFVPVLQGTAGAMKLFQCTSVGVTVGTGNIAFAARAFTA